MCFQLYVGTTRPIPRKAWSKAKPDINVADLSEYEQAIKTHFSKREVQYVGSSSDCGCDFPHLMFQNGDWPSPWDEDPDEVATHQRNQEGLVALLQGTAEENVELYGIWSADFSGPKSREEIPVKDLLDSNFYFKEGGFYKVRL